MGKGDAFGPRLLWGEWGGCELDLKSVFRMGAKPARTEGGTE